MKRLASVLAVVLYGMAVTLAQTPRAGTPARKPATAAQRASQPKFKAVFEPVNYKEELSLYRTSYERWR